MSGRRVAIIGAGVSGLAAGSYLQACGFSTEIYEMASIAGGVSVSWRRDGYVFDGATNWLPGSSAALNLHGILAEVIDFSKLDIIEFDEFARIELLDGTIFRVWKDCDLLEREMLRISPHDRAVIRAFTGAVRKIRTFSLPVWKTQELYTPSDLFRLFRDHWRLLFFVLSWRGATIDKFFSRLKSERLRTCMRMIFPHHGFFSLLALLLPVGWMCMRTTGYPIGGSARFNEVLLERYCLLGGSVRFNRRVRRIIIGSGRAVGLELWDGSTVQADAVLSSADGYETLINMLPEATVPAALRGRFGRLDLYPAMLQISFGVRRTFKGLGNKIILQLRRPIPAGDDPGMSTAIIRLCGFDPTLAPRGCTSVIVTLRTSDEQYWIDLRAKDPQRYASEKKRIAEAVTDELEQRFGNIRTSIDTVDVATPATYVRYTNIWRGSYQGWAPTPAMVGRSLPRRIRGLEGFYLCGQWVESGGGLPRAVLSARNTVQLICRDFKTVFTPPPPTAQVQERRA
ncbi:MAG: NAD(P)/FAD-dependent oxidoreductase [Chitinispirillaceae bacterium]|nr:NAD(P)/FAD-dependent oxidoreductase [Chitinispirillaceae bacterium]